MDDGDYGVVLKSGVVVVLMTAMTHEHGGR